MQTSAKRVLTTHVGSLPRPDALIALLQRKDAGEPYDERALEAEVANAVADVVRKQAALGIDVVDDGEESKISFIAYANDRLAGFEPSGEVLGSSFAGSREFLLFPEFYDWVVRTQHGGPGAGVRRMVCRGPISYKGMAQLRGDIAHLKAALQNVNVTEAFMPATSPANIERWQRNDFYRTEDEYLAAIAEAMRVEYNAIVDAGLVLQIDDPSLSTYYTRHPNATIEECLAYGELRVEVLNHALRDIPPTKVRYHTCYGINMGPRTSDLEMKHLARLMLKVRAGAYSFEAANPRHEHEWRVWEDVRLPEGKALIPGVVTHTSVLVEHPELVAERITRFAAVVGRENVIAGADCGFATHPSATPEIHPTIAWAKLQSLVEGAAMATKYLWAVLALVLVLYSPSSAAPPLSGPPYEINALVPLTGSGAFLGKSYTETFHALEIAVNTTGGIKGRPLKFVLNDTQTSPQTGLQIVNGLMSKHVAVFIDGGPSTVCLSTVPIVLKTGPVDYCLSPVIHPPAGSFVFSASVSNADQAKTGVRYFRERGWTRIAMITSTDSTGEDYERQTEAALQLPENRGLTIVDRQHFNPTDVSVAAQIAHIKASGAQAILAWTTGTPLGTVLRGIKDVGLDVPIESAASNMTYAQMSAYANIMPRQLFFTALLAITPEATAQGPLHDAQVAYNTAFKAIGVKPDEGHILAWDPSMIIIAALRHLGPDATADQIRNYIAHLHGWVGIDGVYDFGSGDQRGVTDSASAIARWDEAKGAWVRVSKPRGYL